MTNKLLLTISLLALIMAACAPAPTPTATPTETAEPTATDTPEPTETDTPEPTETDTPEPTETDTPEPTETDTPEPTETETPVPPTNTPRPANTSAPANTAPPADTSAPADTAAPTNTTAPTAAPTNTTAPSTGESITDAGLREVILFVKQTMEGMGGQIDHAVNTGQLDCYSYATGYYLIATLPQFDVSGASPAAQGAYTTYQSAVGTMLSTSEAIYLHCTNPDSEGTISYQTWGTARQGLNTAIELLNQALAQLG